MLLPMETRKVARDPNSSPKRRDLSSVAPYSADNGSLVHLSARTSTVQVLVAVVQNIYKVQTLT